MTMARMKGPKVATKTTDSTHTQTTASNTASKNTVHTGQKG